MRKHFFKIGSFNQRRYHCEKLDYLFLTLWDLHNKGLHLILSGIISLKLHFLERLLWCCFAGAVTVLDATLELDAHVFGRRIVVLWCWCRSCVWGGYFLHFSHGAVHAWFWFLDGILVYHLLILRVHHICRRLWPFPLSGHLLFVKMTLILVYSQSVVLC